MRPASGEHLPWPKQIGWLVLLWAAGVAAVAVVALLLRALMTLAGMKS